MNIQDYLRFMSRVPSRKTVKPKTRPKRYAVAQIRYRGTFSPLNARVERSDYSVSAEVHRERIRGERMTRADHRRLVRRKQLHAQRRGQE